MNATSNSVPVVGVGMLGHAFMGRAHSNAYKTVPYMVYPPPAVPALVAIAGRDERGVAEAARRFGFQRHYTDWHEMLSDPAVQLFDNSGSNDAHAEPCIEAARAGKHVLCEKPMARSREEAQRMLDAVRDAGVKHMVGFNYRFVPAVRQAYELIRGGSLGEIYHFRAAYLQDWGANPEQLFTWRFRKETTGSGALGDLGSHIIDLARFLIGEPKSVSALTRTIIPERPLPGGGMGKVDVDDALEAAVEFENGAVGTLEASRCCPGRKNYLEFEVNGSKGSLHFNLERLNELQVYRTDAPSETKGFADVLMTEPNHPMLSHWWPPGHIIGWEHTFVHEIAHLLDCIANDKAVAPYAATFEDGYRNAVISDAILRSADEGRRVGIEY
jgi:predicted dehydrogenase